jgi:hypothetical protein
MAMAILSAMATTTLSAMVMALTKVWAMLTTILSAMLPTILSAMGTVLMRWRTMMLVLPKLGLWTTLLRKALPAWMVVH